MSIYKTYRYKLAPTVRQERLMDGWIDTCRFIYNLALETKQRAYDTHRVSFSLYEMAGQLPELRREFDWIKSVPSIALRGVINRLYKSYDAFYKGGGFPNWSKKSEFGSMSFASGVHIKEKNKIRMPKLGLVKYINSRELSGKVCNSVVKKEFDGYYISITTKQERKPILRSDDSQVGIDVGITFFASLSTGEQIDNPKFLKNASAELRIEQRSLSRKEKGSNNWLKQKRRVNKVYARTLRQRKDFLHKQSTRLVNSHSFIAIEKLDVSNMVTNKIFSGYISDVAWSSFFSMTEYKIDWYGGKLIKVDPRYTSQTCNDCGTVDKKSRISQSKFVCTECGAESNADINAAKNILARAIANVREREPLGCALGKNPKSNGMPITL